MQTLFEDLGFACRSFFKTPTVCILIVITLALGIGANAAIFSIVHNVLLAPLPFSEGEQLVKLKTNQPQINRFDVRVSVPTALDYINQNNTLSHLVEYHQMPFTLLGHGEPANVEGGVVSWNFFEMLGVKPILGRTFLPGEDEQGAQPVIVLSYHYWQEKFNADPDVIGMSLAMNESLIQVVGVLPPLPAYPFKNDIWMGSSSCSGRGSDSFILDREKPISYLYGRLKNNISLAEANRDLNGISNQLAKEFFNIYPESEGLSNILTPIRTDMTEESSQTFYLLMGITFLVLLVACANVANLNLARTASRKQEFAIREALGANPRRIARQVMTESVLLSMVGGMLGLAIAFLSVELLAQFAALYTPLASEVKINTSVLIFCLIVSLFSGIFSGAAAAFQKRNINQALKEGSGNVTVSWTAKRLRQSLLVMQFSLAFIILTSAVLVSLSLYRLNQQNTGFETTNIVAVSLSKSRFDRRHFVDEIANNIEKLPETEAVAYASLVPLVNGMYVRPFFQIEGQVKAVQDENPEALGIAVSANYHQVLNIPLIQGRYLESTDDENNPGSILVNQRFVEQFFTNESPIGKRISLDGGTHWKTIRGVVGNVREVGLDREPEAMFYHPYMEGWQYELQLLISSQASLASLTPLITRIIHQSNSHQPVANITTLGSIKEEKLASSRLVTLLVSLFALLAFIITLGGVVGVVAYSVSQSRKEIGIRVTLGANPRRIGALFAIQGLSLSIIGILLGGVIMAIFSSLLMSVLFATDPLDFTVYALVALIVVLVTGLAILWPINQATAIQPIQALREQ